MKLKKSYKGFVIWLIVFCVMSFGVCFLPIEDSELMTRMVLNICTLGMALLAFLIYRTQNVYWYNGTSFEEALSAGTERRKWFALRHLTRFGSFAVIFLVFSVISYILGFSIWTDILVMAIGLIITAVSTITIKL